MSKIGGLGRGLDSLFADTADNGSSIVELRITEIEPNKSQPRKNFDAAALNELAASIKENGLLQPILVRPYKDGYQIVAGERRWRACRLAGLNTVKATVMEMDDNKVAYLALIENLQRENLDPIEEAAGYKDLAEKYGVGYDVIASKVNKSRSYVANAVRLLNLDQNSLNALREGKITVGHAKALLSIEDTEQREQALIKAVGGASVRETEKAGKSAQKKAPAQRDSFINEVEITLKNTFHRGVKITADQNGKGKITLDFYNKDELKEIANRLGGKEW
ncbi:MAG: ParB/RepB/Spo0J family partition protein [Oscillospiraceae bacterium]|nr:ParB/RepB/Spo0J family partition protein [Candidatus Equicaccousia limihippi]